MEYIGVGVVPITKKFLQPNYLFALRFREGFIFGRVIEAVRLHYRPYKLVDSSGNAIDISPGDKRESLRLRDPRRPEDDVLYIPDPTLDGMPVILHGSFGVSPSNIRVYIRCPEGSAPWGKWPGLSYISAGDDLGYISSVESPYETPTDFAEIVAVPRERITFDFYNKDSARSHQPVLNLLFSMYQFQVLTPSRHMPLIRAIARREVPAAYLTAGIRGNPLPWTSVLESSWGTRPMSLGQAAGI